MNIGILCEGHRDIKPVEILISRIIKAKITNADIKFITQPAKGPILPVVEPALALFFESEPKCNFSVFVSDIDKDNKKLKIIRKKIVEIRRSRAYNIIGGFPNPNFECWLLTDETAIKTIFRLSATNPLPHKNLDPKKRLEQIYDNDNDIINTLNDRYCDITNLLDFKILCRKDKGFNNFYKDLLNVVNQIKKKMGSTF